MSIEKKAENAIKVKESLKNLIFNLLADDFLDDFKRANIEFAIDNAWQNHQMNISVSRIALILAKNKDQRIIDMGNLLLEV